MSVGWIMLHQVAIMNHLVPNDGIIYLQLPVIQYSQLLNK